MNVHGRTCSGTYVQIECVVLCFVDVFAYFVRSCLAYRVESLRLWVIWTLTFLKVIGIFMYLVRKH